MLIFNEIGAVDKQEPIFSINAKAYLSFSACSLALGNSFLSASLISKSLFLDIN